MATPSYLSDLIRFEKRQQTLRSESTKLLHLGQQSKRNYCHSSFVVAAPRLWNKLPFEIREAKSVTIFRKETLTHFYIFLHLNLSIHRPTLRSSVCAYTLLRRVLIHADCRWPSPTPSTTLPLYEMITCFIQTKLQLGHDFQRNATVFKWGQCTTDRHITNSFSDYGPPH